MKYKLAIVAILVSLLSFNVHSEQATESMVAEVESVVKQYFSYFDQRNIDGMESLTTKELHVLDIGADFSYREWAWYMRLPWESELNDERDWSNSPVVTKNFRTRVVGDFAYTNFDQYWSANPYYVEVSSMVFRRVNGKWLIDRFSIHDGQSWKQWLDDRLWRMGGVVERNWYEIYVNEVYKEKLRLAR